MDVQELNRACELAFLVAREGVEQDPPIDPPAPMRMFLYVREFPQRALTVARQVLAEDEEFRQRVAARATAESVGEPALAWLNQTGVLEADDPSVAVDAESGTTATEPDAPVTKESIQSELDELKSLVGQLSEERQAVDSEVHDLERSLSEPGPGLPDIDVDRIATASSSLVTQIRNLHTDLKQARMERDHAQEARELAIIEQAELAAQLEQLRALATSTEIRLGDLESRIAETTAARHAAEAERQTLEAERAQLLARAESMEGERDHMAAEAASIARDRAAVEERLAAARTDIERLNVELDDARSNAGASVSELRAALAASEVLTAQVEELSEVRRAGRTEMERVNAALADHTMSGAEKISLLESVLNQVVGERDALARNLELVRTAVSSVQTGVATLDSSVADAENAAGVLGARVQDLRASVDGLQSEPVAPGDLSVFDTPDIGQATVDAGMTEESSTDGDEAGAEAPLLLGATDVDEQPESAAPEFSEPEPAPDAPDFVEPEAAGPGWAADVEADAPEPASDVPVVVEPEAAVPVWAAGVEADAPEPASDVPVVVEPEAAVPVWAADVPADADEMAVEEAGIQADDLGWLQPTDEGETAPDDGDAEREAGSPQQDDRSVLDQPSGEVFETTGTPVTTGVEQSSWSVATFGSAPPADAPHEDLDEVHALVAETVASFEPGEEDTLPGASVDAETAAQAVGPAADRGGLASLFSSFVPHGESAEEYAGDETRSDTGGSGEAGVPHLEEPPAEPAGSDGGVDVGPKRTPISVPEDLSSDPVGMARYVVQTEDAVLIVDGDPVAALGWPTVDRVDQRRNLVHFLHALAGTSGVAPDVLLDRDHGTDRLPDSQTVRVRVTEEAGSVAAQILGLIDSYPPDWPVVVVTDDRDLAAEAGMKGATVLDNGQLLDLFIAS